MVSLASFMIVLNWTDCSKLFRSLLVALFAPHSFTLPIRSCILEFYGYAAETLVQVATAEGRVCTRGGRFLPQCSNAPHVSPLQGLGRSKGRNLPVLWIVIGVAASTRTQISPRASYGRRPSRPNHSNLCAGCHQYCFVRHLLVFNSGCSVLPVAISARNGRHIRYGVATFGGQIRTQYLSATSVVETGNGGFFARQLAAYYFQPLGSF